MRFGKGLLLLAATPLAALMLASCGGGGGGTGSSQATEIFAQDATNTNYSHLWVTIDKLTLSNGGTTTTVFDDTSIGGRVVDLRSLWNDQSNSPQFLLLGQAPTGTYTAVNVTLEPNVSVVPTSSSAAVSATFSGANGPVTLSSGVSSGGGNQIVIDFDLSKWTLSGSTVTAAGGAFIKVPSSVPGLGNPSQHIPFEYMGQVSGLSGTAPNQTFTLSDGPRAVGTVDVSQTTVVFNLNGSPDPSLADGEEVGISGTFDPTSKAIVATGIAILPALTAVSVPQVTGVVTADSATSGTLTVQNMLVGGFLPPSITTNISVSSTTTFYDANGVSDTEAQFFAAITPGTTRLVASGTDSNGALQAATIKIIGHGIPSPEAAFVGKVTNADPTAGMFDLTVQEWQGLMLRNPTSTVIHVTTSGSTTFNDGASQTETAFFGALTPTTQVFVRGDLDVSSDTLAATTVAIGHSFPGDGAGVGGTP